MKSTGSSRWYSTLVLAACVLSAAGQIDVADEGIIHEMHDDIINDDDAYQHITEETHDDAHEHITEETHDEDAVTYYDAYVDHQQVVVELGPQDSDIEYRDLEPDESRIGDQVDAPNHGRRLLTDPLPLSFIGGSKSVTIESQIMHGGRTNRIRMTNSTSGIVCYPPVEWEPVVCRTLTVSPSTILTGPAKIITTGRPYKFAIEMGTSSVGIVCYSDSAFSFGIGCKSITVSGASLIVGGLLILPVAPYSGNSMAIAMSSATKGVVCWSDTDINNIPKCVAITRGGTGVLTNGPVTTLSATCAGELDMSMYGDTGVVCSRGCTPNRATCNRIDRNADDTITSDAGTVITSLEARHVVTKMTSSTSAIVCFLSQMSSPDDGCICTPLMFAGSTMSMGTPTPKFLGYYGQTQTLKLDTLSDSHAVLCYNQYAGYNNGQTFRPQCTTLYLTGNVLAVDSTASLNTPLALDFDVSFYSAMGGVMCSATDVATPFNCVDIIFLPPPTSAPTQNPTAIPTQNPSFTPTSTPTTTPTDIPTHNPSFSPTAAPTPGILYLQQAVAITGLDPNLYSGNVKSVFEHSYAASIGACTGACTGYLPGISIASTVTTVRRSTSVTFTSTVPSSSLGTVSAGCIGSCDASTFVYNMQRLALIASLDVSSLVVVSIAPPQLTSNTYGGVHIPKRCGDGRLEALPESGFCPSVGSQLLNAGVAAPETCDSSDTAGFGIFSAGCGSSPQCALQKNTVVGLTRNRDNAVSYSRQLQYGLLEESTSRWGFDGALAVSPSNPALRINPCLYSTHLVDSSGADTTDISRAAGCRLTASDRAMYMSLVNCYNSDNVNGGSSLGQLDLFGGRLDSTATEFVLNGHKCQWPLAIRVDSVTGGPMTWTPTPVNALGRVVAPFSGMYDVCFSLSDPGWPSIDSSTNEFMSAMTNVQYEVICDPLDQRTAFPDPDEHCEVNDPSGAPGSYQGQASQQVATGL